MRDVISRRIPSVRPTRLSGHSLIQWTPKHVVYLVLWNAEKPPDWTSEIAKFCFSAELSRYLSALLTNASMYCWSVVFCAATLCHIPQTPSCSVSMALYVVDLTLCNASLDSLDLLLYTYSVRQLAVSAAFVRSYCMCILYVGGTAVILSGSENL